MRRNTIKRWTGACLLGSAVATGCSQFRTGVNDPAPWASRTATRPPIERVVLAQPPAAAPQPPLARNGPLPAMLPAAAPEAAKTVQEAPLTQTALQSTKDSLVDEPAAARKAFTDTTAHPCFNHSADYSELTGQIQHSRITKGWRLRYASVDEVDPYGGSVTLIEDAKLSGLKDGDLVRVHGRLLNREDRGIAPPYEVDSIQPLAKRE